MTKGIPTPGSPSPTPLSWRLALLTVVLLLVGTAWLAGDILGPRGRAALGVPAFIALTAVFSANLRAVNWRTLLWGFVLQILLALFVLRFEVGGIKPGYELFQGIAGVVQKFLEFTDAGSRFVFGNLAHPGEMNKVFPPDRGFVFAFTALPAIIFVSAFFTVLYYFGLLQWVVRILARVMIYLMGTSGAETLCAAANIFMGQTEAPLIVKPYIKSMTESELLAVMVGGMATISAGMMAVYIGMGADRVAILATSVMAAPCSLYLAKLLLPEMGQPETLGTVRTAPADMAKHPNVIDAAAAGTSDGLMLALNVGAMLIAFLAFIAMIDYVLQSSSAWLGAQLGMSLDINLTKIFGWCFSPAALLMGVESDELTKVGDLLGIKLVANEFVAYVKLTTEYKHLSPRSFTLATYALTGFANFASIGIQIGGIGALAPERRGDLARLGGRALLAGFLATLVNASLAGLLL